MYVQIMVTKFVSFNDIHSSYAIWLNSTYSSVCIRVFTSESISDMSVQTVYMGPVLNESSVNGNESSVNGSSVNRS